MTDRITMANTLTTMLSICTLAKSLFPFMFDLMMDGVECVALEADVPEPCLEYSNDGLHVGGLKGCSWTEWRLICGLIRGFDSGCAVDWAEEAEVVRFWMRYAQVMMLHSPVLLGASKRRHPEKLDEAPTPSRLGI